MDKLTDLEICKRIAEIEGETVLSEEEWFYPDSGCLVTDCDGCSEEYNPLTDKALCWDLMNKHDITVKPAKSRDMGQWCARWDYDLHYDGGLSYADTPEKALCLAVIEKQNNKA